MKTITMYELLGLVKDGKELPKKVKVLDVIYEFDDHYGDYLNKELNRYLFVYMTSEEEWKLAYFLNDEVEILEEEPRDIYLCGSWLTKSEYDEYLKGEEEKKIPEKLDQTLNLIDVEEKGYYRCIMENIFKINEIIDYLKSKGDE